MGHHHPPAFVSADSSKSSLYLLLWKVWLEIGGLPSSSSQISPTYTYISNRVTLCGLIFVLPVICALRDIRVQEGLLNEYGQSEMQRRSSHEGSWQRAHESEYGLQSQIIGRISAALPDLIWTEVAMSQTESFQLAGILQHTEQLCLLDKMKQIV